MNMNTWISNQEQKHLAKIAKDVEQMMWGHSPNDTKRKHASQIIMHLLAHQVITSEDYGNISKMIHSNALEDLDFAMTLIETITTQNSTQDGSNIHSSKSQVPELRS